MRRPKSRTMKVLERVPSAAGSAVHPGASMTVKPGLKAASAAPSVSRRNMFCANRLCQAYSVMTRTGSRWAGSAPA